MEIKGWQKGPCQIVRSTTGWIFCNALCSRQKSGPLMVVSRSIHEISLENAYIPPIDFNAASAARCAVRLAHDAASRVVLHERTVQSLPMAGPHNRLSYFLFFFALFLFPRVASALAALHQYSVVTEGAASKAEFDWMGYYYNFFWRARVLQ